MIRILIQGTTFIILLMTCSCRNNHTEDRPSDSKAENPLGQAKPTIPVAVSAMELCAHFNTDVDMAISRYKDNVLILSGKAEQSEVLPVDNDCRNVIIKCQSTDSRDTGSLSIVIKRCIRDEIRNDTIVPGKDISIQCRFIAYQDRIIRMEEVTGG